MVIASLLTLNNLNNSLLNIDHNFLILLFYTLSIFFIFNILGYVYLGDSGTYAIALLVGIFLIEFKSINDLVSPYYIASLLWYPAFENLFSLLRRVIKKKDVSNADNYHLHQLIFLFLESKKVFARKMLNSTSSIIILIFNIPGIIISNLYATKSLILIVILFTNILFYLLFYYFFSQNLMIKK